MPQLLLLFAAAAALTLGEAPGAALCGEAGVRTALALGGFCLLLFLAVGGAMVLVRGVRRAASDEELSRWIIAYDRMQRLHFYLWGGYVLVLLLLVGWGPLVREVWGLARFPLVDDCLILLPILLPPLAAWSAWHEVELTLEDRLGPLGPPLPRSRVEYLLQQVRGPLAIAMGPMLLMVAGYDVGRMWLGEDLLARHGWLLGLPVVIAAFVFLPLWIKQLWNVEPLGDSTLRRRLARRAERLQTPVAEISLWRADSGAANAAVLGFLPWHRCVLLSEELLARLDDEEVEAVFAHELAHVVRGHLWLRLAGIALPLALLAILAQAIEPWANPLVTQIAIPAAALLSVASITGWISWWIEFDADAAACQSDGSPEPDPRRAAALYRALAKLAPTPRERASGSWLHPSLDARLAALEMLAATATAPASSPAASG